jgi:hypothetical protein
VLLAETGVMGMQEQTGGGSLLSKNR